MNENLKKALTIMLFMSDEQPLGEDIEKINFKRKDWYMSYHWTVKTEERFSEWLSEYLKKNWQGISQYKPTSKKTRDKLVDEFILNYGCVCRPLKIEDFTSIVSWAQLDEVMSKQEREKFNKWMFGQTTSSHGVYRWDLERWLNVQQNFD